MEADGINRTLPRAWVQKISLGKSYYSPRRYCQSRLTVGALLHLVGAKTDHSLGTTSMQVLLTRETTIQDVALMTRATSSRRNISQPSNEGHRRYRGRKGLFFACGTRLLMTRWREIVAFFELHAEDDGRDFRKWSSTSMLWLFNHRSAEVRFFLLVRAGRCFDLSYSPKAGHPVDCEVPLQIHQRSHVIQSHHWSCLNEGSQ